MKLGLLTADVQNPMPNIGDYFITRSLEKLFPTRTLLRVPLHVRPTEATLEHLRECDAVLLCGTNIVGPNGTVRSAFEAEHFASIHRPIIPIGLGSQADLNCRPAIDSRGADMLRFWFKSSGMLSVRDRLTFDVVEGILGPGSACLTGCPSLTLSAPSVSARRDLSLFCPGPYHYLPPGFTGRRYRALTSEVFSRWNGEVWMAQQPSDLLYTGTPLDARTLYSPRYPDHHLQAIASARSLLTFRIHPALLAIAHGTPAVVLAIDERVRSLARSMGIPTVEINANVSVDHILRRATQSFHSYPWPEIETHVRSVQTSVKKHLASKGLSPVEAPSTRAPTLSLACIADGPYLPRLNGLLRNLLAVHAGELKLYLLVLDSQAAQFDFEDSRVALTKVTLEEIWGRDRSQILSSVPVAPRAYASKASLLHYAVKRSGKSVFFLDVDLFFFQSPAPLFNELNCDAPILLFPHWHDDTGQTDRYGIFNSGMVGARPEALPFLAWWAERCFENCTPTEGNFYEQSYLDRSLLQFPFIRIYSKKNQNVAFWNLKRTRVVVHPNEPWAPECEGGIPITSFHAARPDVLGLYETKYAQDQLSTLFSTLRSYSNHPEYIIESLVQKRAYWPFAKRVSYLFDLLRARFKISDKNGQRVLSCLLSPLGRRVLAFAAWGYRLIRDKKRGESRVHPTLPPLSSNYSSAMP